MRPGWQSGRVLRSFLWCCPSTSSVTACAMRSIRANAERVCLDHALPQHTAAIHLKFKIDDRRPGEMPGQPGTRCAATGQFVGHREMEIVHGIGLNAGHILPAEAKLLHSAFHLPRGKMDLIPDAF